MYDGDEHKKTESRGTESVINALILARDDVASGRKAPSPMTETALHHLRTAQAASGDVAGSWEWLKFGMEPWEADDSRAFGAALAAIAISSAPSYSNGKLDQDAIRSVDRLRKYLRRRFADESLYNRLWILEASTTFEGILSAEQRDAIVKQLLTLQRDDGGWALAPLGGYERIDGTTQADDSDGYATGLAAHVLLRAGVPPTRPEVAKALSWLRTHQRADGAWPGQSVNKKRDPATFAGQLMTDAATAFAASAIVEAQPR
jgi:hypothetical protein